jgi:M6 family metalloprotease-like protein
MAATPPASAFPICIPTQQGDSMSRLVPVLFLALFALALQGVPVFNQPVEKTQPDGTEFQCLLSGDEFFNYYHDADGYTIIQSPVDGFYYYAEHLGDDIAPSNYRVGSVDPASEGLESHVVISPDQYRARRDSFYAHIQPPTHARPTSGNMFNISVLIRFSDQSEFTATRQSFDNTFNNEAAGAQSLLDYYQEASYGNLTIRTFLYPTCAPNINLSYQDSHPRSYYCAYNAVTNPNGYTDDQRTEREHTLLINAIDAIADQVPDTLTIDANFDGRVDNVSFIIRGQNEGWSDLIWGHRWTLFSGNVSIHNKMVYDYTFVPESQSDVYTHCHEMFHSLGAPDLYHYNGGIDPAGPWDLMDGGFVHMGAYMKYRYGYWIDDIPEITGSGLYTLHPLTEPDNNCYRIPAATSDTEFFVVEYRKDIPGTYESAIPRSGLVIYRINGELDGQGNASGPPDEVYVYRPGGTLNNEGSINAAAFSSDYDQTEFNSDTSPSCFLSDGSDASIAIHQIGPCDDTISFYVNPAYGFITGSVTTDNPNDDLTQAVISANGDWVHPNPAGQYELAVMEGSYSLTASMPFHTSQTMPITVPGLQEVQASFNLNELPAPSNLEASHEGNTINLTWLPPSNLETFISYRLYRQIPGYAWTLVTSPTQTEYSLTLNPTLTYRFFVNAAYTGGISDSTNLVEVNLSATSEEVAKPMITGLGGAYPNPFNPSTAIRYSVAKDAKIRLCVYDLRGQRTATLLDAHQTRGTHSLVWNGTDNGGARIASGVYFLRMEADGSPVGVKKLLLLK